MTQTVQVHRFGAFELDLRARELRKRGVRIKLQDKPLQILALLLENPGSVVTREELRKHLWPAATFVDFDHGVNTAVNKLREALGESAENPKFIETLSRHGYRFIAGTPVSDRVRLAVLPLDNLSGDPGEEPFVDGMTEELITQLAGFDPSRLGVIARTSIMRYKQTTKGIDEISRELGVEYLVEGSARRESGRVRICAQLIQARDQTHIWAQSYEYESRGILALQSEVACAIASRIRIEISPRRGRSSAGSAWASPEACELYLKGRYHLNRANPEDLDKAVTYFRDVLRLEPHYAPAYTGIADAYMFFGLHLGTPRDWVVQARDAAVRALELDPDLAVAHCALAFFKILHEWDWAGAEAEAKRALELEPGAGGPHRTYGILLSLLGRHAEAVAEARLDRELDPLSSTANYYLGFALYMARRYDEAIRQLREVLDLDPSYFAAHIGLGHIYAAQARYAEALAEFAQVGSRPEFIAWIHALAGRPEEARLSIAQSLKQAGRSRVVLSVVYALLGVMDEAFASLEQAFEERDSSLTVLKAIPSVDPLRADPRFADFLGRMNFPE